MTVASQFRGYVDYGEKLRCVQAALYELGECARAERDAAAQIVCRCEPRPVFDRGQNHCVLCGRPWVGQHIEPAAEPDASLFTRVTWGDPDARWPDDYVPVVTVCLLKLRNGLRLRLLASEAKRREAAEWHSKRLRRNLKAREARLAVAA